MRDPIEFLEARIAEDEAAVSAWDSDGRARIAAMWVGSEPGYTTVAADHSDGHWVADGREVYSPRQVQVLFDPARVLAECAAKRELLQVARHIKDNAWQDGELKAVSEFRADQILRALFLPYTSHPDYDESWKP